MRQIIRHTKLYMSLEVDSFTKIESMLVSHSVYTKDLFPILVSCFDSDF